MSERFATTIRGFGNNAGIEVPPEVLAALGAGRRPRVRVQVEGYTFTTTMGAMSGLSLISLSKAHRDASGLHAGQEVQVELELDTAPLVIDVPSELAVALDDAGLSAAFDALAPSRRKEHARQVADAKADATRQRRIAKVVAELSASTA